MESHDDGNRKWYFPSAVSEATHDEWTVRQILMHLDLFSGIKSLRADVNDSTPDRASFCLMRKLPPSIAGDPMATRINTVSDWNSLAPWTW